MIKNAKSGFTLSVGRGDVAHTFDGANEVGPHFDLGDYGVHNGESSA